MSPDALLPLDVDDLLGLFQSGPGSQGPTVLRPLSPFTVDCTKGDSCEAIDAILTRSRRVRERVVSHQADAIDKYKAASRQITRELSLLPPTYEEYVAVKERAASARERRRELVGDQCAAFVSHPLLFHLGEVATPGAFQTHGREDGHAAAENSPPKDKVGVRGEEEGKRRAATVPRAARWASLGKGAEGEKTVHSSRPSKALVRRSGLSGSPGQRHGHSEPLARSQAQRRRHQLPAHATWNPNPIHIVREAPALQKRKIRARGLVFSLLDATRAEEEEMEAKVFGLVGGAGYA
ncbi:unnamed protein product, partial [Discosporangium mesarthrocarpum]